METSVSCFWCRRVQPMQGARLLIIYDELFPHEEWKCFSCQVQDGEIIFRKGKKKGGGPKARPDSFGLVELGNRR